MAARRIPIVNWREAYRSRLSSSATDSCGLMLGELRVSWCTPRGNVRGEFSSFWTTELSVHNRRDTLYLDALNSETATTLPVPGVGFECDIWHCSHYFPLNAQEFVLNQSRIVLITPPTMSIQRIRQVVPKGSTNWVVLNEATCLVHYQSLTVSSAARATGLVRASQTGLVISIGHLHAYVGVVVDGRLVRFIELGAAGDDVNNYLRDCGALKPSLEHKRWERLVGSYSTALVAHQVKMKYCTVALSAQQAVESANHQPCQAWKLLALESIFNPALVNHNNPGVVEAVKDALSVAGEELAQILLCNIITFGGVTNKQAFQDRLRRELKRSVGEALRSYVAVRPVADRERCDVAKAACFLAHGCGNAADAHVVSSQMELKGFDGSIR